MAHGFEQFFAHLLTIYLRWALNSFDDSGTAIQMIYSSACFYLTKKKSSDHFLENI